VNIVSGFRGGVPQSRHRNPTGPIIEQLEQIGFSHRPHET
jgi:hypothetical protein